jgi:hypothetical protein
MATQSTCAGLIRMATCEPSDGGAITYRFRRCERCRGQANEHPVRHIEHGARSACADVEIADLVLACWQAGIATSESCQNHGKRSGARLVFLSMPSPPPSGSPTRCCTPATRSSTDACSTQRHRTAGLPPASQGAYGGTGPGMRSAWRFMWATSSHSPRCRS